MDKLDFNQISTIIRRDLDELGISYKYLTHEPTPTSQDSADVRGVDVNQGIKALIVESSLGMAMCCIPADEKLDFFKVSELVGAKIKMGDRTKIEALGLQIGGIPPLGHLIQINTFYDRTVLNKGIVWFNCGTQTESIAMSAADLIKYANPQIVDII